MPTGYPSAVADVGVQQTWSRVMRKAFLPKWQCQFWNSTNWVPSLVVSLNLNKVQWRPSLPSMRWAFVPQLTRTSSPAASAPTRSIKPTKVILFQTLWWMFSHFKVDPSEWVGTFPSFPLSQSQIIPAWVVQVVHKVRASNGFKTNVLFLSNQT